MLRLRGKSRLSVGNVQREIDQRILTDFPVYIVANTYGEIPLDPDYRQSGVVYTPVSGENNVFGHLRQKKRDV